MPRKILIADDEPHIRMLIQQTLEELEDEGVTVLTASDGEEAMNLVDAENPDLIFLDVMMPKMNGFDVCQGVRSAPRPLPTYIVLLTAKGQEFDRKRGLDAGADVYMTKPFDPDELLAKARTVLEL